MCGIAGIVGLTSGEETQKVLYSMNHSIAHRGPDDSGIFVEDGVGFGQRRLAIIDVSAAGHQPMTSVDGRLVLIFNGEIYNYRELKAELSDYPFQTGTDTEVILAAYNRWGKECVHRFNGMFAFAIWDRQEKEVLIFRDRLGIKPLYFYQHKDSFIFSSEIRAVLASGLVPRKLNKAALWDYLRYQTVHAPETMVAGVEMLLPGHFIQVKEMEVKVEKYWAIEENYSKVAEGKSYNEIKQDVHDLLLKAVERRLVADVPFGAFLSGGIDSSAIVALMCQVSSQTVKTFSVTFEEEEFSEAKYAALVAKKYHTTHTEIRLKPEDFLNLIPSALKAMDHPSGDGPNTFVVSKVTKEAGITMALSGLGGDELFAGYDVFKRLSRLSRYNWVTTLPRGMRKMVGDLIITSSSSVAATKIGQMLGMPDWQLPQIYPITRQVLPDEVIQPLVQSNTDRSNRVQRIVSQSQRQAGSLPYLSQVAVAEITTYMQNTLLRDTDQMSMAHALEVRVPFLDHKLVEYVTGISDKMKYPYSPKKLLTDAMAHLIPEEVVNRPKMGFIFPWQKWLKKELYEFVDQKMKDLGKRGIFVEAEVNHLWKRFLAGDPLVSWSRIWYLVVLENWMEENGIEA